MSVLLQLSRNSAWLSLQLSHSLYSSSSLSVPLCLTLPLSVMSICLKWHMDMHGQKFVEARALVRMCMWWRAPSRCHSLVDALKFPLSIPGCATSVFMNCSLPILHASILCFIVSSKKWWPVDGGGLALWTRCLGLPQLETSLGEQGSVLLPNPSNTDLSFKYPCVCFTLKGW